MKYKIELSVRGRGVQLMKLTPEEVQDLLEEDLDEVYEDWVSDRDYEFSFERQYITWGCDRFRLTIKDENDNTVYDINDPKVLEDRTYDEDDEVQVKGWEFEGVEDGDYLTRIQVIKGCNYECEFDLDEPFDESKLYLVRDEKIDDELLSDDVFPIDKIYYQRGEGYDKKRDEIIMDFVNDLGEQYFKTHIFNVTDGDYWEEIEG